METKALGPYIHSEIHNEKYGKSISTDCQFRIYFFLLQKPVKKKPIKETKVIAT